MVKTFIEGYSEFYRIFFDNVSDSVLALADLQNNFREDFESIRQFSFDPKAIEKLLSKLSPEEQGIFLKILLRAGSFGSRLSNMFDSTPEDKKKLAEDLKNFSNEIDDEIKKVKIEGEKNG